MSFEVTILHGDHVGYFYPGEIFEYNSVDDLIKGLNKHLITSGNNIYCCISMDIMYKKFDNIKIQFLLIERFVSRKCYDSFTTATYEWNLICYGPYEDDSELDDAFMETDIYGKLDICFTEYDCKYKECKSILKDDLKDTIVEYYKSYYKNT